MNKEVAQVWDKINMLRDTSSTVKKVSIMKGFLQTESLFKDVVRLAYHHNLQFNMKKLPDAPFSKSCDFYNIITKLIHYSEKSGLSLNEKVALVKMCDSEECKELVSLICNKDLRIGMGAVLINEACPGLITIIPYMRCSKPSKLKNIVYPAIAQNKEDGLFCNVKLEDYIKFETRSGGELLFPFNSQLFYEVNSLESTEDVIITGELRITGDDGKYLPRKQGNPLINKALSSHKNTGISIKEANRIHLIAWDLIPKDDFYNLKCEVPYEKRFEQLHVLVNFSPLNRIHCVLTEHVHNEKEVYDFTSRQMAMGEEGAVIKNLQGIWEHSDGGSPDQIKLKAGELGQGKERIVELRVVGFQVGESGKKYSQCIGSLVCVTEDGLLETYVGIGLSDQERRSPYHETFHNKIISVRFNDIIYDDKGNLPRLYLARFEEIRHDKLTADTLDDIKEECNVI